VKAFVIVMHPFGWKQNPKTRFWDIKAPRDLSLINSLIETVQGRLESEDLEVRKELYSESTSLGEYHPGGMFSERVVPKEFEIVLSSNPENSYFHSKASWHKKQKFIE